MDLWEKFGMSEGIAELWQELGISAGTAIVVLAALYFVIKWAVKAERSFKYTDHFIDWSFYRACNLCMSGLQDTSQGLCYAVGAMVYRYFILWHIYDCPFDNSHYHKADSL